ncbi:IPT/TIG domain-containing protein [Streptomyces decoyicus]|uniref:IPT/TIG domain-containing protein n=1 Tax=Streptomyces decoyicus TaxID=249567 RepID=UPI002E1727D0
MANNGSDTVSYIDTAANTVSGTVAVGHQPTGVGVAQLTVTTPGGISNPQPYVYSPGGELASLAPGAGPTAGRNIISIEGHRLRTATQVRFGSVPAVPTVVSDELITVTVPPGAAPGLVPVTVTTAGGNTPQTITYAYIDPPFLSAVSPSTGPVAGGNVINLYGLNLSMTSLVTFHDEPVQYSVQSDTVLTVVVPPELGRRKGGHHRHYGLRYEHAHRGVCLRLSQEQGSGVAGSARVRHCSRMRVMVGRNSRSRYSTYRRRGVGQASSWLSACPQQAQRYVHGSYGRLAERIEKFLGVTAPWQSSAVGTRKLSYRASTATTARSFSGILHHPANEKPNTFWASPVSPAP